MRGHLPWAGAEATSTDAAVPTSHRKGFYLQDTERLRGARRAGGAAHKAGGPPRRCPKPRPRASGCLFSFHRLSSGPFEQQSLSWEVGLQRFFPLLRSSGPGSARPCAQGPDPRRPPHGTRTDAVTLSPSHTSTHTPAGSPGLLRTPPASSRLPEGRLPQGLPLGAVPPR